MLSLLAHIIEHPIVLLAGIAIGYLLPSDVKSVSSKAASAAQSLLALIKSKL